MDARTPVPSPPTGAGGEAPPRGWHLLRVRTACCLEFIDLTDLLRERVAAAGIEAGTALVQSLHTTAAVIVNENEPLLIEDMRRTLERVAPRGAEYRHDDFDVRTENMTPDERPNGHSHCKGLLLPTSVTLGISGAALLLGRWQRVFLCELDRARHRTVAVLLSGAFAPRRPRETRRGRLTPPSGSRRP